MKKLLALLLAATMLLSFAACGDNKSEQTNGEEVEIGETLETPEEEKEPDAATDNDKDEEKKDEVKTEDDKTEQEKPADKKEEEKKEEEKPSDKPAAAATVGNTLLSAFKAKAGSSSALAIAEALAQHEILPFMAGASAVEPGLLSGFDNAEITGFKEGAMFAPMMSSQAFVGYVFVLEDGVNAADFIANLRKNANLRWNVCVEAEEMVTGNVGNKVFFVMCPKQFEE